MLQLTGRKVHSKRAQRVRVLVRNDEQRAARTESKVSWAHSASWRVAEKGKQATVGVDGEARDAVMQAAYRPSGETAILPVHRPPLRECIGSSSGAGQSLGSVEATSTSVSSSPPSSERL